MASPQRGVSPRKMAGMTKPQWSASSAALPPISPSTDFAEGSTVASMLATFPGGRISPRKKLGRTKS